MQTSKANRSLRSNAETKCAFTRWINRLRGGRRVLELIKRCYVEGNTLDYTHLLTSLDHIARHFSPALQQKKLHRLRYKIKSLHRASYLKGASQLKGIKRWVRCCGESGSLRDAADIYSVFTHFVLLLRSCKQDVLNPRDKPPN